MNRVGKKSIAGVVITILATACLGLASWGFHKSTERATNVTFPSTTKFKNGDTLPAGTYRMEVPDNSQAPKVKFSKNGKVVATESAKVVTEQKKNDNTAIESVAGGNAQLVTAIRPAGWEESLVFGSAGHNGTATP